ncbi:glycine oxidase ThiO [Granulosicoccaceae sp. 1_MG-2023]|nr:glycine oxidase ThiO [Granulosicoccaceae sp. 1_MG-2023]
MKITLAGAGLYGRLLAWRLAGQGHRLTLLDPDPPEHGHAASHTAAGMLTPWAEADGAEAQLVAAGIDSLQRWPALAADLGSEIDFRPGGSLLLAHGSDVPELHRYQQALSAAGHGGKSQWLDTSAIQDLEPALEKRFQEGLFLPDEASVNSTRVMRTLHQHLSAQGVSWLRYRSADFPASLPQAARDADLFIDCRGLGARRALPGLRGVRGEVLHLHAPDLQLKHMIRLMHPRYKLYLVPRRDDIYVLGATQIESEDRGPVSVRSALELLSAAYTVHPAFGEARVLKTDTNLRPALFDNHPLVTLDDNLLTVNGLFRHGYLLAPLVTELALGLINGRALPPHYHWMGARSSTAATQQVTA